MTSLFITLARVDGGEGAIIIITAKVCSEHVVLNFIFGYCSFNFIGLYNILHFWSLWFGK